ncbi:MAG TPA: RagB/SusD family nutrient uptake outer membrane protein [Cytophagales bacterium]|nr:RagB/SusD family nutrient uptake outer membrane protein [Cytophagales bacterium]
MMQRIKNLLILIFILGSCNTLDPAPQDIVIDELVLNEPQDVVPVEIGLYTSLRGIASPVVILNDLTTDLLIHQGTFSEFRELSNKDITAANAIFSAIWASIYRTIYVSNFILERLPEISGVDPREKRRVIAAANFCRGYAYFIGANCFGGIPITTSTDVEANSNISRATKEEVLALAETDLLLALENLPAESQNEGFASVNAARAALARFYLYNQNWELAEKYSSDVILSEEYELVSFENLVTTDDTEEAILEVGYTLADDPGTTTYGLNNQFEKRREIIPSNKAVSLLNSSDAGERFHSISFDVEDFRGSDNGWSVAKYGTADEDNNDIVLFRLGEMYLIRAEARANLGKITGGGSAEEDINTLRTRANSTIKVTGASIPQMLSVIEQERIYELAFEGHRWFDLVRTGRATAVMSQFTQKWADRYNVWPIPIREIQNNPSLVGAQNPGY